MPPREQKKELMLKFKPEGVAICPSPLHKEGEKGPENNAEPNPKKPCREDKKVNEFEKILKKNMAEKLAMSFDLFELGLSGAAVERILNIKTGEIDE